jgi:hypothetical protein
MRLGLTFLAGVAMMGLGFGAMGCVASSTPEANGYNVQLFFDGAPLGTTMEVGDPGIVTVKRIQQRLDRCAQSTHGCDPTVVTPIVLVSAACDDGVCTVTSQESDAHAGSEGVVTLRATGVRPGTTTLRVRVRSVLDGSEWDDGYPLAFRAAAPTRADAPAPVFAAHAR